MFKAILFSIIGISLLPISAYSQVGKANIENRMLLESEKNTISVFKDAVNSVVNITNLQIAGRRGMFYDMDLMQIPAGTGSGFLWGDKGYIVTNSHVVHNGDSFLVSFHNNDKQYKAKLVGAEPNKDIAVLKLEELPKNLKPVKPSSMKTLQVGQKAIAIGNPFGLDHSITTGIVSATGRKIPGFGGIEIHGMIQTDCSINPGNSGGPLFDSSGRVIGMNTMIFSSSGSSSGIGFAVPIGDINRIVPQIIKHGKVTRPALGIGLLEKRAKEYFGISKGIVIKYVDPKGPAGKAGLKGMARDRRGKYSLGDIITEIDGKKINSYDDIYNTFDKYSVGDEVLVTYIRNGKTKKIKVKLKKL